MKLEQMRKWDIFRHSVIASPHEI